MWMGSKPDSFPESHTLSGGPAEFLHNYYIRISAAVLGWEPISQNGSKWMATLSLGVSLTDPLTAGIAIHDWFWVA